MNEPRHTEGTNTMEWIWDDDQGALVDTELEMTLDDYVEALNFWKGRRDDALERSVQWELELHDAARDYRSPKGRHGVQLRLNDAARGYRVAMIDAERFADLTRSTWRDWIRARTSHAAAMRERLSAA